MAQRGIIQRKSFKIQARRKGCIPTAGKRRQQRGVWQQRGLKSDHKHPALAGAGWTLQGEFHQTEGSLYLITKVTQRGSSCNSLRSWSQKCSAAKPKQAASLLNSILVSYGDFLLTCSTFQHRQHAAFPDKTLKPLIHAQFAASLVRDAMMYVYHPQLQDENMHKASQGQVSLHTNSQHGLHVAYTWLDFQLVFPIMKHSIYMSHDYFLHNSSGGICTRTHSSFKHPQKLFIKMVC